MLSYIANPNGFVDVVSNKLNTFKYFQRHSLRNFILRNPFRKINQHTRALLNVDEAALIDGGNRDDFSTVMLKILRTGIEPSQITRLIYQHYDPDLCGSLPQLEAIINNDALRIISHSENNVFIHYYSAKTEKLDFRELGNHYEFSTGRRLEFYATPYCHHPGSFVTYDTQTKTLFSSDLFGSFDARWTYLGGTRT